MGADKRYGPEVRRLSTVTLVNRQSKLGRPLVHSIMAVWHRRYTRSTAAPGYVVQPMLTLDCQRDGTLRPCDAAMAIATG
jgi:hypothetical protein